MLDQDELEEYEDTSELEDLVSFYEDCIQQLDSMTCYVNLPFNSQAENSLEEIQDKIEDLKKELEDKIDETNDIIEEVEEYLQDKEEREEKEQEERDEEDFIDFLYWHKK